MRTRHALPVACALLSGKDAGSRHLRRSGDGVMKRNHCCTEADEEGCLWHGDFEGDEKGSLVHQDTRRPRELEIARVTPTNHLLEEPTPRRVTLDWEESPSPRVTSPRLCVFNNRSVFNDEPDSPKLELLKLPTLDEEAPPSPKRARSSSSLESPVARRQPTPEAVNPAWGLVDMLWS